MLGGSRYLRRLFSDGRLTAVVDVGANPIDGDPPYSEMLRAGMCTLTGFEPQTQALDALERKKGALERYLPDALGDGGTHTLNLTSASGMTSMLNPDEGRLALFNGFSEWGRVVERIPLQTRRLDEVEDIQNMDMLKIDVQGAELMIFRGAKNRLSEAVVVHTEVSFVPLYKDQPTFGDIDGHLRTLGFIPHAIAQLKRWPIAPVVYDGDARKPMHQILEADMVYMRDVLYPDNLTDDQLRHLAMISHCVYGSSDLTYRMLLEMVHRGIVPAESPGRYLSLAHPVARNG
jgi:FkbM family methyltransferase